MNPVAARKWGRFFCQRSKKGIIVPVDHGLGFGPLRGIESTKKIASWIDNKNIDGIIAHKGILERLIAHGVHAKAIMLQLSGMTVTDAQPNKKELITDVECGLALGVDAVSVQANFDGCNDRYNLINISQACEQAKKYNLPILAMIYNANKSGDEVTLMRHYLRIAVELGVDAVKIPFYSQQDVLLSIIDGFSSDMDIFVAGGDLLDEGDLLTSLKRIFSSDLGVSGVALGRNVFQRSDISQFLEKVRCCFVGG